MKKPRRVDVIIEVPAAMTVIGALTGRKETPAVEVPADNVHIIAVEMPENVAEASADLQKFHDNMERGDQSGPDKED